LRSRDRSNEPYPLVRSSKAFFLFDICVLSCSFYLFVVLLGPDARLMLEGVRSKSFEDLQCQEQEELKTLSSYSLKERQVFPCVITIFWTGQNWAMEQDGPRRRLR
jgi:hypothetical protein